MFSNNRAFGQSTGTVRAFLAGVLTLGLVAACLIPVMTVAIIIFSNKPEIPKDILTALAALSAAAIAPLSLLVQKVAKDYFEMNRDVSEVQSPEPQKEEVKNEN